MQKTKNFIQMTFGSLILAVGIYFFKIPNGFTTGGVTGIGTVLAKITPITPGIWIWILNILFLFLGFVPKGDVRLSNN